MMTDPISDMLTRVRNAISAGFDKVDVPGSRMKAHICSVLKEEGYIRSFKVVAKSPSNIKIRVYLKEGAIVGIQRHSSPGLRVYKGYREIPRVASGLGVSILSTSKGILSSRKAKKLKVGGEVVCRVW